MSTARVTDGKVFRLVIWLLAGLLFAQPLAPAMAVEQDECKKAVQKADQLYREAQPDEAIKLLKQCLDRPDSAEPWRKDAYVLLAKCYLQTDMLERVKEAEKAVEALLRIDCSYRSAPEPESLYKMVESVRKRVCGGQISVISPTEADSWEPGSKETVQWTWTNLTGDVKIEFSSDGGKSFRMLVDKTRNTGSMEIDVPSDAAAACVVKLTSIDNPGVAGSSAQFAIAESSWWSNYKWYAIGGAVLVGGVVVALVACKEPPPPPIATELPNPPPPPAR